MKITFKFDRQRISKKTLINIIGEDKFNELYAIAKKELDKELMFGRGKDLICLRKMSYIGGHIMETAFHIQ